MTNNDEDQAARIDELEYRLKVFEQQNSDFFRKYSTLIRDQEEPKHKLIEHIINETPTFIEDPDDNQIEVCEAKRNSLFEEKKWLK